MRCSHLGRRRCATALPGFGRFHLQRIVEAIEIIEKPNRTKKLDNLAFRIEIAQFGELFVGHRVRIARYCLSQAQSGFLSGLRTAPKCACIVENISGR